MRLTEKVEFPSQGGGTRPPERSLSLTQGPQALRTTHKRYGGDQ
jgi:hypothetical protein